ncbi:MAG: glutamate 5-kinase [Clostridia bacterium]|nr:glutamate 5-kinase [Clostridia bacterium]
MEKVTAQQLLRDASKIVVKLGSNTISDEHGMVNREIMKDIVGQIMRLINEGKRVTIVSSGATICGVAAIDKWHRKSDMNYKQALSAIGQVELMNAYKQLFWEYGVHVGQILLTGDDFHDHKRELNIRNTLFTLVDEGVVPVINENDSVSTEEYKIGDNDTLSALTSVLWDADVLVLMSDIDGVYDKDPNTYEDAKFIDFVEDVKKLRTQISTEGKSSFGTGGIVTKLNAAEIVNEYGISMILTNSRKENILGRLEDGEEMATVFFGR